MAVLDVLPLLPTGGWIAELGLKLKVVTIAEKRALTWRSLPQQTLSTAVRIIVVDAAPGNAANDTKSAIVRVEQHLVGLLRIAGGVKNSGHSLPAGSNLGMQLIAAYHRVVVPAS